MEINSCQEKERRDAVAHLAWVSVAFPQKRWGKNEKVDGNRKQKDKWALKKEVIDNDTGVFEAALE